MKKTLILSALLMGLGSVATAASTANLASQASLASQLPTGALATFEAHKAGPALDRFVKMVSGVADAVGQKEVGALMDNAQQIVKGVLGDEAVIGIFSVGKAGNTFSPEVLGVAKVDELAGEMLGSMVPKTASATVGKFTFSRQDKMFVGKAGSLVYFSSNKALLMGYLGRLSGKNAPRLMSSVAYTAPTKAMGQQEMSLFTNFSAIAKVVRSQLAAIAVPRLLSPLVDALDTLGQLAGGFSTNAKGLTTASAQTINPEGKDKQLYRILTDTTEFEVQNIIPADAESVAATACHPETGAYLGRWLTRIDMSEPFGFLTDSQLASNLETSARYLGNECAQVTLAGSYKASLGSDPLASLPYSITYQKVTDLDMAQAHMPEFAKNVNDAIAGLGETLKPLLEEDGMSEMASSLPKELAMAGAMGSGALAGSADQLNKMIGGLKLVYAFRDDYLITAYSQAALDKALAEDTKPLAEATDFTAAKLNLNSAGWQFSRNLPNISAKDFSTLTQLDDGKGMYSAIGKAMADLVNRYDGSTSQTIYKNNLITSKTSVNYRW